MNNLWLIKNYEKEFPFNSLIKDRNLSFKENDEFLNSDTLPLKDPFVIKDMEIAVDMILNAISENKKIIIYGDYDVDGISAVSILYLAFKLIANQDIEEYTNFDYFIPKREDGYGLTKESIAKVIEMGAELIITVDCGITSLDEVEYIKEKDIEIIVTDHHNCKEELPKADAIINPKQEQCISDLQCLCGAGIAYYIARALFYTLGIENEPKELLEIATIATVADMVHLQGENRKLVTKGLKLLQNPTNLGIKTLLNNINNHNNIDSTFIAFNIAPIINSSGRMYDAELSVKLLLSTTLEQAEELCNKLINLNYQRKEIEREIFQKADLQAKTQENNNIIIAYGENWHTGVSGIIASKITEKYIKPSIVVSFDEQGIGKGSVRSVPGINILNILKKCSNLLIKFGGHDQAAGITIEENNIEEFKEIINQEYIDIYDEAYEKLLDIDAIINPEDINLETMEKLQLLEPFGMKNQKPLFCIQNIKLLNPIPIGKNQEHFKCTLQVNKNNFEIISFFNYSKLEKLDFTRDFDIAFHMDINSFNGNDKIQLNLKDIKYSFPEQVMYEKIYNSLQSILCFSNTNSKSQENQEKIETVNFRNLNQFTENKTLILCYSSDSYVKLQKIISYLYKEGSNKTKKISQNRIDIILFPIIEKIDFSLYNNVIISFEHKVNRDHTVNIIKSKNSDINIYLLKEEILQKKEDLKIRHNMKLIYNLLNGRKKGAFFIDKICKFLKIKYIDLIIGLTILKDLSLLDYKMNFEKNIIYFEMSKDIKKSQLESNEIFINLENYFLNI